MPLILRDGGAAYAAIGTEGSAGPKLFCLSGHVARPGIYEVPFGTTLRELLELAGGVPAAAGVAMDEAIRTILLGGAAGVFVGPEALDTPLTFEGTRAINATLGSGVVMVFDQTADLAGTLRRIAAFFRDESCGQCVPCRVGTVRQEELLARLAAGTPERLARRRAAPARRDRPGDARRLDLRPRPDGLVGDRERGPGGYRVGMSLVPPIQFYPPARSSKPPAPPAEAPPAQLELTIDGQAVSVDGGLDDPRCLPGERRRHADPVLPREPDPGQRLPGVRGRGRRLARPRARLFAQGRGGDGRPDRHRAGPAVAQGGPRAPRLVGRPVDRAPGAGLLRALRRRSGTLRSAAGPGRPPASATATRPAITTRPPARPTAATVAQPVKIDNELYVRDYSKCILCYKCVEACGVDAQNTFAIAVAGRGFDARISTEWNVGLPDSACVYCGNCIGVCPTGALMFRSEHEMREAGHLGRIGPDHHRHDLPVLRRRLHAEPARPGQRDRQGDLAARLVGDRRPPVRQGPLRLRVRPGAWPAERRWAPGGAAGPPRGG